MIVNGCGPELLSRLHLSEPPKLVTCFDNS